MFMTREEKLQTKNWRIPPKLYEMITKTKKLIRGRSNNILGARFH